MSTRQNPRASWLQSFTDYLIENIFDIITVGASAYVIIRHQFNPYGPNEITNLATWILAILGFIAVSSLWHQHRRLRSIEDIGSRTYNLASKIFEISQISLKGITAIQDKYKFDPIFWQSVLEESSTKLDLRDTLSLLGAKSLTKMVLLGISSVSLIQTA